MSWTRYPAYQESNVDWLGDIPSSWRLTKLAWHSNCASGTSRSSEAIETIADDVNTVPVIGGNGIMGFTNTANTSDSVLAIGRVGALCGNVHQVAGPAWITDNALRLTVHGDFDLRYLSLTLSARGLNDIAVKTAQPLITGDQVSSQRLPLPPRHDQEAIVAFLGRETAKIDALIAKQAKLIATLREDRITTIAHAVTKGLDENAAMKFSGAEWIGQVPAHWSVAKVKHGFSVTLGKMYQGDRRTVDDVELPHLKAGSLTATGLNLDTPMMCWFNPGEILSLTLKKGDVLVVEGGAIGRCVVLDRDLAGWGFQKSLNRVRALGDDSPEFLAYLIETATESGHVSVVCGKSTIGHFTAEKVAALEWPRAPLREQLAIVEYLDERCAKIAELTKKASDVIETLREYRSALISEAVIGKIDVREAVSRATAS